MTWAISPIPTGAISFGRVKGAQKLSEGWMDVDGWEVEMRHPVLFRGFKFFHMINWMSLFCIKWLLKTPPWKDRGVRLIESLNDDGYSMYHHVVFYAAYNIIIFLFSKMAGSGVWASRLFNGWQITLWKCELKLWMNDDNVQILWESQAPHVEGGGSRGILSRLIAFQGGGISLTTGPDQ